MSDSADASTSVTLLRRLQQAPLDQSAWGDFARRYGPVIYQWCRLRRLQEADAEDVTQTVLVKLVDRMKDFEYDPSGSFKAWLRTVTYHAWVKFVTDRYQSRKRDHEEVQELLNATEAREDLAARLEAEYDRELLDVAMLRVAARVEAHTWEAFRLLAIENLSGADVAERLDIRVATAYKARSKVQQMIQEELGLLDVPGR